MKYLPSLLTLVLGVAVMAGLLCLGAMSGNWVAPVCYLAAAVVYHGWYRLLLQLARRVLGLGEEGEDDDRPFFPG
jgi:hypothetical protein